MILCLAVLYSLLCEGAYAEEDFLKYPDELIAFAKSKNCEPLDISDLWRGRATFPLYAYGYAEGDPKDSAVFWCKRQTANKSVKYYFAVYMKEPKGELAKCPNIIEALRSPAEISFFYDPKRTLDSYSKYPKYKKKIPKGTKYKHNSFLVSNDGLVSYYCHEGDWYLDFVD